MNATTEKTYEQQLAEARANRAKMTKTPTYQQSEKPASTENKRDNAGITNNRGFQLMR